MKTASFFTYKGPGRISIARSAPPAISGYALFRALAPGPWFKSVSIDEYVRRFESDVLAKLDPKKTHDELHRLADGEEPVLLCWEVPGRARFCHRALVAQWFEKHFGWHVPEVGFEEQMFASARHPLAPALDAPEPSLPSLPPVDQTAIVDGERVELGQLSLLEQRR